MAVFLVRVYCEMHSLAPRIGVIKTNKKNVNYFIFIVKILLSVIILNPYIF